MHRAEVLTSHTNVSCDWSLNTLSLWRFGLVRLFYSFGQKSKSQAKLCAKYFKPMLYLPVV